MGEERIELGTMVDIEEMLLISHFSMSSASIQKMFLPKGDMFPHLDQDKQNLLPSRMELAKLP